MKVILKHPDSLLGALQRGRGDGFLAALEAGPAAAELVLQCVLEDPRWDRQLEQRDRYYAELLIAIEAPTQVLWELLEEPEPEQYHLEIVSQLILRNHKQSQAFLEKVLVKPEGVVLLEEFAEFGWPHWNRVDPAWLPWLADCREGEFDYLFGRPTIPWEEWCQKIPGLASARNARRPLCESRKFTGSESLEELWQIGTYEALQALGERHDQETTQFLLEKLNEASQPQFLTCMRILGRRAALEPLQATIEVLESDQEPSPGYRSAYLGYLETLPGELLLPHARRWVEGKEILECAALMILHKNAQEEDRHVLEAAVLKHLDSGEFRRACTALEGLDHIGAVPSLPVVLEYHRRTEYSYGRNFSTRILANAYSEAAGACLRECLWDCEDQVVRHVLPRMESSDPTVTCRIEALRSGACPLGPE